MQSKEPGELPGFSAGFTRMVVVSDNPHISGLCPYEKTRQVLKNPLIYWKISRIF